MTTTATLEEQISAGHEAKRILESEVFRTAVIRAENAMVQEWKSATNIEVREMCHARFLALAEVLRGLRVAMGDGEQASHKVKIAAQRSGQRP